MVDLSGFIGAGIFSVLKDPNHFAKGYSTDYSVGWSDNLEIDAPTILFRIDRQRSGSLFYPHNSGDLRLTRIS